MVVSLEELIASGREIRTDLLQETYGITGSLKELFIVSTYGTVGSCWEVSSWGRLPGFRLQVKFDD
jgi:hypothetical protein